MNGVRCVQLGGLGGVQSTHTRVRAWSRRGKGEDIREHRAALSRTRRDEESWDEREMRSMVQTVCAVPKSCDLHTVSRERTPMQLDGVGKLAGKRGRKGAFLGKEAWLPAR